ncbi:LOW QUALITY PROTEIN: suppressor of SWI4 1 homolog [Cottoperca gobio]|uniref:LOW QUALITY PROTEIN: suppressor of SWI4 1 homolog n=1 Tax=Cottoperca gobio TaxID=56716 RepID=A0A6J2Q627_COTGO|nr:LOW QUALITY PROTEIN: suppressor of SWI4 1 homolog [Cottoperca gobio]
MGKSKTKNQKKSRATANHVAEEIYGAIPHSFVFHRGQIGKNVGQLIEDVRRVMEPYTAESLKVRKKNVLKDFVAIAGPLGVTHFMIFSKTPTCINMRLARLPKGPMLHFRVLKYSLVKDVVSSLKKHRMHEQQFTHHPLLILNNFGSDGMHVKLMSTMFQNMFPSINVHKVSLNNIKRCVLLNYNPETQEIEFRHYSLKVVPVGMSRGVKKLMQERFPNMSKFEDISELMMKGANLSESEAEQDGDHNITELPQIYSGRGNMASQQSAVRLTEIGPRMTLQLAKIEEGMGDGNVLYHTMISKTEEEIQEILNRKEAQLKEKARRRKKQEHDVAQKAEMREDNKKKSLAGIKRKRAEEEAEVDSEVEDPGRQDDRPAPVESDDEVEYYRQAVGQEPDEDMFPSNKKYGSERTQAPAKKWKKSPGKPFRKDRDSTSPGKPFRKDRGSTSPGKPFRKDRDSKSPRRNGPGGYQRDGKGWKNDGEKPFGRKMKPGGKAFGGKAFGAKKPGDREKKFGGKKNFEGNKTFGGNKDKSFKSKGPKGTAFKKKGAGAKQGFKQRKGKGSEIKMEQNLINYDKFQIALLPSMYGVEFVVALTGNLFALWLLVVRERRNWHTGVVLSCNLVISDLLYVLTLPLLIVYYALEKHWVFSNAVCKIERFLFTCNLYVSIFFIMAISVNRCVALVCPFFSRSYVEPFHAKAISVIIWIVVGVFSFPALTFSSVCHNAYNNNTQCVSYCNKEKMDASPHFNYTIFLSVFGCLVPFIVTVTSYCLVISVVWKNVSITKLEKRKVGLLITAVIVLYAISFVPYHVFQLYHFYQKSHKFNPSGGWVYKTYQLTKGLATLNMCLHPILYMALFDSIRVVCCGKSPDDDSLEMRRK